MATIRAVCTSERKGEKKKPVAQAQLRAGHGIEGDAHAGSWHRQLSLLGLADIDGLRRKLPGIVDGDFGENLVIDGLDLDALGLGSRLRLGAQVEIVLSQRGKVCHTRCAIYHQTGDCIMPRAGLFAQVLRGGTLRPGDGVEVLAAVPRPQLQIAVITVSDSCAAGTAEDTAGPAVAARLQQALGGRLYGSEIVADDRERIAERLRHYCEVGGVDLVVAVGGTGFAPRDVTPEAVRDVAERLTPGLDEAMRAASARITPQAMLSRAASGIRGQTLILSTPGSRKAALENIEALLPALPHGLAKLRGDDSPCGDAHRSPA